MDISNDTTVLMKWVEKIIQQEFQSSCSNLHEITDFGSVSRVFSGTCDGKEFVIKLNADAEKFVEFQKEKWCLETVSKLGIPSPDIWAFGKMEEYAYLILTKIPGKNATLCTKDEKISIWESLGKYAKTYHCITEIAVPVYQETVFHKSWDSYLAYNISELNSSDPLLIQSILTLTEHLHVKEILSSIKHSFQLGMIHRDLSLRNVIFNENDPFLLDWGTAEMGIVPHNEIGAVLMQGEITEEEFAAFLKGLEIDEVHYAKIEKEIRVLNLLDSLDRYRWALGNAIEHIKEYGDKVRLVYGEVIAS